jgi:hypothetical protein
VSVGEAEHPERSSPSSQEWDSVDDGSADSLDCDSLEPPGQAKFRSPTVPMMSFTCPEWPLSPLSSMTMRRYEPPCAGTQWQTTTLWPSSLRCVAEAAIHGTLDTMSVTAAAVPAAIAAERLRPIAARVRITTATPIGKQRVLRFSPGPVSPLTPRSLPM